MARDTSQWESKEDNLYYGAYFHFIDKHPELEFDEDIMMWEELAHEYWFTHLPPEAQDYLAETDVESDTENNDEFIGQYHYRATDEVETEENI